MNFWLWPGIILCGASLQVLAFILDKFILNKKNATNDKQIPANNKAGAKYFFMPAPGPKIIFSALIVPGGLMVFLAAIMEHDYISMISQILVWIFLWHSYAWRRS